MYLTQRSGTPQRREPAARRFHGDAIDPTAAEFAETSPTAATLRLHSRSSRDAAPAHTRLLVAVAVVLFYSVPVIDVRPGRWC